MVTKVFVTGASGFIAQHIIKVYTENGYYVVGTVRSSEKGEALKQNLGPNFEYEIVKDIVETGAFDSALQKHSDISYVLHTASPFFYGTTDPEHDLIIPAINGTKNILDAVKHFSPSVKKFVITSSDAAIYSSVDEQNLALSFDETSWNQISYEDAIKDPIAAYYGAKSFAEKLAWEFVKKESPSFKVVSVNPGWVFGPQAFASEVKDTLNTSNEVINAIVKAGPDTKFDNDKGSFIDVRDVAKAHLAAVENDQTTGKRLFLTNGQFSVQMIVDILNEKFPNLKGTIPVGVPGTGAEDIKSLAKTTNDTTRKLLGYEFTCLDKVVEDTIQQVLDVKIRL